MITEKDINTAFENEFDGQEKSLLVQEILKGRAELERHRWIPVGERLPEVKQEVLAFDGLIIRQAEMLIDGRFYSEINQAELYVITHWKPIILPKEKP